MMDIPRGSRKITTFRKLPTMAPRRAPGMMHRRTKSKAYSLLDCDLVAPGKSPARYQISMASALSSAVPGKVSIAWLAARR
jgi:hypothetical protein